MAQLAIKGRKERGKEVIALLEMLGGKNESFISYDGRDTDSSYRITDDGCIVSNRFYPNKKGVKYQTYTLEELEKEFPYKVGDEVRLGVPDEVRITNMYWDPCSDQVIYEALSVNGGREYDCLNARQLSPCKEQSSPDKAKAPSLEGQDYSEGRCSYKIPEGFEFDKVENGEIILKPKKKELPKTYGKCCEILGFSREGDIVYSGNWVYGYAHLGQHLKSLRSFSKLLICRDAYWKLADDWKPCWNGYNGDSGLKYCIFQHGASLMRGDTISRGCILMFPTAEMRDTFYENFENLINECKELL
ncbi:MAG: hypothetical protein IJA95_06710 [Bacteroidaceae bacterium]|nr:hypothetical protein [Bacteroidaceae bacterium]